HRGENRDAYGTWRIVQQGAKLHANLTRVEFAAEQLAGGCGQTLQVQAETTRRAAAHLQRREMPVIDLGQAGELTHFRFAAIDGEPVDQRRIQAERSPGAAMRSALKTRPSQP